MTGDYGGGCGAGGVVVEVGGGDGWGGFWLGCWGWVCHS